MAQSHQMFTFPKLSDYNYREWSMDMKVLLIDRNCWEFITGTAVPYPPDSPERDKRDFRWRKQRAYTTIFQGIDRKYQRLISSTEDGQEAWTILKTKFVPPSRARLAGLIDEFFSLRFEPDRETIGIFCKKIQEYHRKVKGAGFEIPDILVCFHVIRRLPDEYGDIVQVLYRLEDKEFEIENVTKQLVAEASRIELKRKDEGDFNVLENAFSAKAKISFQPRLKQVGL